MVISILTAVAEIDVILYTVPVIGIELGQLEFTALGVSMILLLIMGSGFFSSSEIAMFSLSPYQIDAMVEQGKRGARAIKSLKNDPHRLLVTILVGNNLVNITMSSISTTIVGFYFDAGTAVIVSSLGITSLVLLFGESAPKSYAVDNTDTWARTVAPLLKIVEKLLWPLITVFYHLTRAVNKVTPGGSAIESSYVSREDIRNMIKMGEREGILDEEERQILNRTLRFTDATAKEVMTPRLDMAAISKQLTVEQAIEKCIQSGHARLPVYEESLDNVIGVFDFRDLNDADSAFSDLVVEDVLNPTLHVPESKNVDELLSEMRNERIHMVIIIDEFGTTEGLITMEDVTEEIVGEILMGDEDHPIEFVNDNEVLVQGEVNIHEINEVLDIDLPEGEEFETIAGFIFNLAGRLVEQDEEFNYENVTLRTEQLEDTRIRRVRIAVHPDTTERTEEESPLGDDEDSSN
ncbi:hemolysin family protein [Haloquadratum walsbyi]|jgi:Hemolysins and related proteins containing CBS domains|uniref:Hemolysin related proteins containing CBS domain protein n=1 Tax=Haloquadratum walsbyi J07HQW2 TaxID=1238425 RepID=U1NIL5_9EURY|nr:hemolysin family protein [Haloquadratum walsbyi]ERG97050.1 MAG: hemolysin related proteins containing CBS domain protein [Haloquadratum walsbyi J07HQW2]